VTPLSFFGSSSNDKPPIVEPEEDEDDEDAFSALMQLRPAAHDSLGGDEDEEATRPLVGSERANYLTR